MSAYRTGEPERWFIFGVHPETGRVGVSNGERDVLVDVTREDAERAIAKQNALWDAWLEAKGKDT